MPRTHPGRKPPAEEAHIFPMVRFTLLPVSSLHRVVPVGVFGLYSGWRDAGWMDGHSPRKDVPQGRPIFVPLVSLCLFRRSCARVLVCARSSCVPIVTREAAPSADDMVG